MYSSEILISNNLHIPICLETNKDLTLVEWPIAYYGHNYLFISNTAIFQNFIKIYYEVQGILQKQKCQTESKQ